MADFYELADEHSDSVKIVNLSTERLNVSFHVKLYPIELFLYIGTILFRNFTVHECMSSVKM
jgi:hypothetical protein